MTNRDIPAGTTPTPANRARRTRPTGSGSTTPRSSTTPAASRSSRGWTASRATRRSSARSRRSRTSSTAAPPAPTRATGDGAGILLQLPDEFFRAVVERGAAAARRSTASRVCFLPRDDAARRAELEQLARAHGRGRGPARRLLARRARSTSSTSATTARAVAPDRAAARRRRLARARGRPGRLRAQALRDPPGRRARRRARPRDPELLLADDRLQGDADGAAARGLLPRPAATRARRPRSCSSTRASRPTPSRAGSSRTRTG